MRTMLRVTVPVEAGNAALKSGKELNAAVEFIPVMNADDRKNGLAAL